MPDMQIVTVNGQAFGIDVLRAAVMEAEKNTAPLKLLVKRGADSDTITIDYHRGLRYPTLTHIEGAPDLLDEILRPK